MIVGAPHVQGSLNLHGDTFFPPERHHQSKVINSRRHILPSFSHFPILSAMAGGRLGRARALLVPQHLAGCGE